MISARAILPMGGECSGEGGQPGIGFLYRNRSKVDVCRVETGPRSCDEV